MFFTKVSVALLSATSFVAAVPQASPPPPMTVTRVFKTITPVPPYIVDVTTVFTFTPSPSTIIAHPTGTAIAPN